MGIESTIEKLRKTIIESYRFVGTVASVNSSEGTSIITTPSGGNMKVKGTNFVAGNKVEIKDGIIIAAVPAAAYYEFDV